MRVAAFQFDVERGDPYANLARVESALERAKAEGCELVVLPELWASSFPTADGDLASRVEADEGATAELASLAGEHAVTVAGSALHTSGNAERPFNRLQLFDGSVSVLSYDKVQLFSPTGETLGFTPGEDPPQTVELEIGRIGGCLCYDLRFPELTRVLFRDGAELVVLPAQWPSVRASQWRALVVGLAAQNQCFVVACNRTGRETVGRRELELEFPGNSLVVDPRGVVLAEGQGAEGLVSAEVDLDVARRLRRDVPVERDQRSELFRSWGTSTAGGEAPGG